MFGCKHKWNITDTRYTPGMTERGGRVQGLYLDQKPEQMVVFGYTEVSMICDNCGQPKVDMIVGKWSNVS